MGDTEILRIVVRENLSEDMIDLLVHDIMTITESLIEEHSTDAHLASVVKKTQDKSSQKSEGNKKHHPRRHAQLDHGSGVKATGYAKQC
jgi:glutamate decarboxylase